MLSHRARSIQALYMPTFVRGGGRTSTRATVGFIRHLRDTTRQRMAWIRRPSCLRSSFATESGETLAARVLESNAPPSPPPTASWEEILIHLITPNARGLASWQDQRLASLHPTVFVRAFRMSLRLVQHPPLVNSAESFLPGPAHFIRAVPRVLERTKSLGLDAASSPATTTAAFRADIAEALASAARTGGRRRTATQAAAVAMLLNAGARYILGSLRAAAAAQSVRSRRLSQHKETPGMGPEPDAVPSHTVFRMAMALKAVDKFQHAKQYARACWELILRYYLLELPYLGPASIAEGMWVCSSITHRGSSAARAALLLKASERMEALLRQVASAPSSASSLSTRLATEFSLHSIAQTCSAYRVAGMNDSQLLKSLSSLAVTPLLTNLLPATESNVIAGEMLRSTDWWKHDTQHLTPRSTVAAAMADRDVSMAGGLHQQADAEAFAATLKVQFFANQPSLARLLTSKTASDLVSIAYSLAAHGVWNGTFFALYRRLFRFAAMKLAPTGVLRAVTADVYVRQLSPFPFLALTDGAYLQLLPPKRPVNEDEPEAETDPQASDDILGDFRQSSRLDPTLNSVNSPLGFARAPGQRLTFSSPLAGTLHAVSPRMDAAIAACHNALMSAHAELRATARHLLQEPQLRPSTTAAASLDSAVPPLLLNFWTHDGQYFNAVLEGQKIAIIVVRRHGLALTLDPQLDSPQLAPRVAARVRAAQATGWTVHILPAFAAEGLEPDEAAERQQTLESRAERDDVVSTPAQPGVANASTKVPRKWIRDRDPERYLGPRLPREHLLTSTYGVIQPGISLDVQSHLRYSALLTLEAVLDSLYESSGGAPVWQPRRAIIEQTQQRQQRQQRSQSMREHKRGTVATQTILPTGQDSAAALPSSSASQRSAQYVHPSPPAVRWGRSSPFIGIQVGRLHPAAEAAGVLKTRRDAHQRLLRAPDPGAY